ncbi:MAG: 2,3-bisphosphoglycerate-independent phosphoglycerate mutase [candidate division WOR-3 bacterium]
MLLPDSLAVPNEKKILLVVIDGLGGLPVDGKTELEAAATPNLDRLAARSSLGLHTPVGLGITPGSGPAHLALFGYDPVQYQVGRGVLEALGVGLEVGPHDLCARANFATIGRDGLLLDRRAGRITTDKCAELCTRLRKAIPVLGDIEVIIRPGREHRFVVVFRGPGLESGLTDSDPLHEGVAPNEVRAETTAAEKAAGAANAFIRECARVLADEPRANCVLLRGLDRPPRIPSMQERFKLKPACFATYPMYKGLARLVGMDVIEAGSSWEAELAALHEQMRNYDFFFLHLKETDKAGEDGDFEAKVELIERFDEEVLPRLLRMGFDVLCITGDHSTPAKLRGHSWHSVPFLLHSPWGRASGTRDEFSEKACLHGAFGSHIPACLLMNLMLAHALKLRKFGA